MKNKTKLPSDEKIAAKKKALREKRKQFKADAHALFLILARNKHLISMTGPSPSGSYDESLAMISSSVEMAFELTHRFNEKWEKTKGKYLPEEE